MKQLVRIEEHKPRDRIRIGYIDENDSFHGLLEKTRFDPNFISNTESAEFILSSNY